MSTSVVSKTTSSADACQQHIVIDINCEDFQLDEFIYQCYIVIPHFEHTAIIHLGKGIIAGE